MKTPCPKSKLSVCLSENSVLAARREDGAALLAEGLEVLIVAGGADLNLDPSDLG